LVSCAHIIIESYILTHPNEVYKPPQKYQIAPGAYVFDAKYHRQELGLIQEAQQAYRHRVFPVVFQVVQQAAIRPQVNPLLTLDLSKIINSNSGKVAQAATTPMASKMPSEAMAAAAAPAKTEATAAGHTKAPTAQQVTTPTPAAAAPPEVQASQPRLVGPSWDSRMEAEAAREAATAAAAAKAAAEQAAAAKAAADKVAQDKADAMAAALLQEEGGEPLAWTTITSKGSRKGPGKKAKKPAGNQELTQRSETTTAPAAISSTSSSRRTSFVNSSSSRRSTCSDGTWGTDLSRTSSSSALSSRVPSTIHLRSSIGGAFEALLEVAEEGPYPLQQQQEEEVPQHSQQQEEEEEVCEQTQQQVKGEKATHQDHGSRSDSTSQLDSSSSSELSPAADQEQLPLGEEGSNLEVGQQEATSGHLVQADSICQQQQQQLEGQQAEEEEQEQEQEQEEEVEQQQQKEEQDAAADAAMVDCVVTISGPSTISSSSSGNTKGASNGSTATTTTTSSSSKDDRTWWERKKHWADKRRRELKAKVCCAGRALVSLVACGAPRRDGPKLVSFD
jgi:hypothetical protein